MRLPPNNSQQGSCSYSYIMDAGPVELAAVGVAIALFNQVSRIAIFLLVSVTTSFVAEEDAIGSACNEAKDNNDKETGLFTNDESKLMIPHNGMHSFIHYSTFF